MIKDRIKEISIKHGLSHVGSNLTAADIINDIYFLKKEDESFVCSSGHCSLALFCVLELHYELDAEKLYLKHGTHPNRDLRDKIEVSTGSLGMGLGIALGMALADRTKNVYCLISDGESFEGIIWEVANVVRKYEVTNLIIYCNFNGWSAYDKVSEGHIMRLESLFPTYLNREGNFRVVRTHVEDYGFIGLNAHYDKL